MSGAGRRCKVCGAPLSPFLRDLFDDRHGFPGRFDILRCGSCGFCQTVPELPADGIGELYSRYYPRKGLDIEAMRRSAVRPRCAAARWWDGTDNDAHCHIRAATTVLDIGCGDCSSLREIAAMGARGYGVEPDANVRAVAEAFGLKVHIGTFDDIPYADESFDYATMSQVLEHVPDPAGLLRSVGRVLKRGGQVIVGVPNVDSRLRRRHGRRWLNWHVPYHVSHFSRRSLELLARNSGYRVARVRTVTPNLWAELQARMLGFPVAEGVKVPFFNLMDSAPEQPRAPWRRLRLPSFLSTLWLRAVDLAGRGESLLAFLEKSP